jgi:hypothetical protein
LSLHQSPKSKVASEIYCYKLSVTFTRLSTITATIDWHLPVSITPTFSLTLNPPSCFRPSLSSMFGHQSRHCRSPSPRHTPSSPHPLHPPHPLSWFISSHPLLSTGSSHLKCISSQTIVKSLYKARKALQFSQKTHQLIFTVHTTLHGSRSLQSAKQTFQRNYKSILNNFSLRIPWQFLKQSRCRPSLRLETTLSLSLHFDHNQPNCFRRKTTFVSA